MMFKIECFVEDKKLAKASWALDGLVLDLKITPVRGAVKDKGSSKVAANPKTREGTLLDRVRIGVLAWKGDRIDSVNLRNICIEAGGYATSSPAMNNLLMKEKILKRLEKGHYEINKSAN
jgi:hypothetical protein